MSQHLVTQRAMSQHAMSQHAMTQHLSQTSQLHARASTSFAPPSVQAVPAPAPSAPRAPLSRSTLSHTSRNLLALYLAALLALAYLGAQNQLAYGRHETLLAQKQGLQAQLQGLRLGAAETSGALAVRRWALRQGMIAAPESLNVRTVPPSAAPGYTAPKGSLELYTLWR